MEEVAHLNLGLVLGVSVKLGTVLLARAKARFGGAGVLGGSEVGPDVLGESKVGLAVEGQGLHERHRQTKEVLFSTTRKGGFLCLNPIKVNLRIQMSLESLVKTQQKTE